MKKLLLTGAAALSVFSASAAAAQAPRAGVIVLQDQPGGIGLYTNDFLKCLMRAATTSKFAAYAHQPVRSCYPIYQRNVFASNKRLGSGFIMHRICLPMRLPKRL